MFDFLKGHKQLDVYRISEPGEELTVRERALKVFSKIEGLDDIKEMMLRALESSERAHTLLTGPPTSAKSLFMLEVEKFIAVSSTKHFSYSSGSFSSMYFLISDLA